MNKIIPTAATTNTIVVRSILLPGLTALDAPRANAHSDKAKEEHHYETPERNRQQVSCHVRLDARTEIVSTTVDVRTCEDGLEDPRRHER